MKINNLDAWMMVLFGALFLILLGSVVFDSSAQPLKASHGICPKCGYGLVFIPEEDDE